MWANRNPASHDLGRIVNARMRKTAAMGHIAALRGSPYAPYEQDRLSLEVKALGSALSEHEGFLSSYENNIDDMKANTYLALNDLDGKFNQRKKLMADVANLVAKRRKEEASVNSRMSEEQFKEMSDLLRLVDAQLTNTGGVVTREDGRTITELRAAYEREKALRDSAMNNIAQFDEQLHELEKQVLTQDASINEAANRAGVEGQSLADYAGDVTRSRGADLVLFAAGGILATALAIGLQRKYQRPTQRGRRGSAYSVFMGA
jgi:hypothetical protein